MRIAALALALFLSGNGAYAHALPGSVLIIESVGTQIGLDLCIPLEDLIIAAPDLIALEDLGPTEIPPALTAPLGRYLDAHLAIETEGHDIPLRLTGARLERARNDHVGNFALLIAEFAGTLPDPDVTLSLTYDAVMHEVRSHRAAVFETNDDGPPMAEFGFRQDRGKPVPVKIDLR
ncbi:hypothetical protein Q4511_01160 [Paracoccus sp. 1_MG-2023]|uniref:hypothetical protein n=1 Tax=unclassified Paracoccus (in: a-proteobacteria) TaxID=2688777 RepID=UPI001C0A476D|nr:MULTISPECIES: hypothetical protein [unclassified Paracoccus (in: a-proteobacteria)]MBU2957632.1 hypothetical protein [Paracoccus sp. C2R09]MDO6667521.1 hypothetical protein [Paracoccus sp. 1_MG-2023]